MHEIERAEAAAASLDRGLSRPALSPSGTHRHPSRMKGNRTLSFRAILGPRGIEPDRTLEIGADGSILAIRGGGAPYDGFLALPGMTNAHSHVFQRALAGMGEAAHGEDSFWSWREAMYRLAAVITAEQLYAIARHAYAEMLRGGFTRVAEFHYLHHGPGAVRGPEMTDAVVRAATDVGLPLTLLPVYYRTAGFDQSPATDAQSRFAFASVDDFLVTLEELGDQAGGVAPHSLRAVPVDDLPALIAGADEILGDPRPFHIHVSEQEREVAECLERFGQTPIDFLANAVPLNERWNLVHATHATAVERIRVRESGASIVLCPLTEAYLGDGTFEAREHLADGGFAAIGTDANTRLSAVDELRCLEYGQRLRDRRRARLANDQGLGSSVWSWAAVGGSRATGVDAGRLESGVPADLVVLDEKGPAILGHDIETALDAWLIGGDDRDIAAVYVGGERRVERGAVDGQTDIKSAFAQAMKAVWST